jgi:DNA (cytosine-5)-methyltransferase 1
MRYLSVCSGIEAASVAWHSLGWTPVACSEIEAFPAAVLRHHYPSVPNRGDMTKFQEWPYAAIDVLVGGTPCQSFSVAGLRKGLADPRGNLALTYLAIADKYRPRWVVWENVPGVLSSNGGRDFGAFVGGLGELGYGWAYRVLDAQYFGVAQRRRRVFVVGYLGDWARAAAVLFERHSLSGHPAPRRETREDLAGTLGARTGSGGGFSTDFECDGGVIASTGDVAACLETTSHDYSRADGFTMIAHALRGEGFDASEDVTERGTPLLPIAFPANLSGTQSATTAQRSPSLGAKNPMAVALATQGVMTSMQVRRLTVTECERLQGFPDGYTAIPWRLKDAAECPDGPRYKALGNSMAVPVMEWIGRRIAMMEREVGTCQ